MLDRQEDMCEAHPEALEVAFATARGTCGLMRSSELNHDAALVDFDAFFFTQAENIGGRRALPAVRERCQ